MLADQRESWTAFARTMNGLLATKTRTTTPAPVRTIGDK
jgi:hypothetical protein